MIATIDFIELTVADWNLSVSWYARVLGFGLVLQDTRGGFALLNLGQIRLALKQGKPTAGTATLTFRVDDIDAFCNHLRHEKIGLDRQIKESAEGYRRVSILDPDGYRLNFYAWTGPVPPALGTQPADPC